MGAYAVWLWLGIAAPYEVAVIEEIQDHGSWRALTRQECEALAEDMATLEFADGTLVPVARAACTVQT